MNAKPKKKKSPRKWHEVESSNVAAIRYAPKERLLQVKFLSGKVYQYANVPAEKFEAFLKAESKGIYLNTYIKDFHDVEPVDEE